MENKEVQTYLKKLEKITSYWLHHNHEHISEHQQWAQQAKSLNLLDIASKLEEVTVLLKKANDRIESIKIDL